MNIQENPYPPRLSEVIHCNTQTADQECCYLFDGVQKKRHFPRRYLTNRLSPGEINLLHNNMTAMNGLECVVAAKITINALITIVSIGIAAVIGNVVRQICLKSSNVPPMVFHWFPIIGHSVSYGIDPFRFFRECQRKVCRGTWEDSQIEADLGLQVRRCFYLRPSR